MEFFESCIILRSTFHLLKNLQLEGRFRGKNFSNASAAKLLSQSLDCKLFLSRFDLWYFLLGIFCRQLQSCRNLCPFPTAENCQNGKIFILKCISALKPVVSPILKKRNTVLVFNRYCLRFHFQQLVG